MATSGERIRQLSSEIGWTVLQLDEFAQLADGTVARLEPGDEQLTAAELLQVGRVLGQSLDYLMIRRANVPAPLDVSVPRSLADLSGKMRPSSRHELALLEIYVRIFSPRPVKTRTMVKQMDGNACTSESGSFCKQKDADWHAEGLREPHGERVARKRHSERLT